MAVYGGLAAFGYALYSRSAIVGLLLLLLSLPIGYGFASAASWLRLCSRAGRVIVAAFLLYMVQCRTELGYDLWSTFIPMVATLVAFAWLSKGRSELTSYLMKAAGVVVACNLLLVPLLQPPVTEQTDTWLRRPEGQVSLTIHGTRFTVDPLSVVPGSTFAIHIIPVDHGWMYIGKPPEIRAQQGGCMGTSLDAEVIVVLEVPVGLGSK
jgi:hypothetical protein